MDKSKILSIHSAVKTKTQPPFFSFINKVSISSIYNVIKIVIKALPIAPKQTFTQCYCDGGWADNK